MKKIIVNVSGLSVEERQRVNAALAKITGLRLCYPWHWYEVGTMYVPSYDGDSVGFYYHTDADHTHTPQQVLAMAGMVKQAHPHAELMAMYAEDAKTTDKPWELWQIRDCNGNWIDAKANPAWLAHAEYRRKPKTPTVHGVEMLTEDPDNSQERDGWTPDVIKQSALKDTYKEYTLQEVLGGAVLPSWVRWVVVTKNGEVVMCELEPVPHSDIELWEFAGAYELVNRVAPPMSFESCIWEVNFKPDCGYTLDDVIGDYDLSEWVRWVAVDKNGEVYEYSSRPSIVTCFPTMWASSCDEWGWIKDIEPPADFTKCIWEVKK